MALAENLHIGLDRERFFTRLHGFVNNQMLRRIGSFQTVFPLEQGHEVVSRQFLAGLVHDALDNLTEFNLQPAR